MKRGGIEEMIVRKLRVTVLVVALVLAFALAAPLTTMAAKKPNDLLGTVISHIDMDYAYRIIEDLSNMHTAVTIDGEPFGFRGAGSASAIEASKYVYNEMNCIGLTDTAMEEIPVDAWEFRGAWVDVPGLGKLQGASFGGATGTASSSYAADDGSITEELVDVGNGFHSGYEGKEVEGKIVLANWIGNDYWVDSMAMEAYVHGAAAIIVTTYDSDYGNLPGAIECHDGLYRLEWPPMISISGDDGLSILEVLEGNGGSLEVTVWSDIIQTTREDGGVGYNVVGYIPGKNYGEWNDELVILGDHTDAWFFGAMDDNSGVAATLVLAKAFKRAFDELGIVPDRTLVFVTHEAEEYGILDTYFDWCYGAWYQVTQLHPEWVGKAVAALIFELMGMKGLPLVMNGSPELVSFMHQVVGQNKKKLPYGFEISPKVSCWADHWTYAAAGIPAFEILTATEEWSSMYYHNQYDSIEIIDFGYLQQLFEVFADMVVRLVTLPIVPYNFETSATNLWETLEKDKGKRDKVNLERLYEIYDRWGIDATENLDRLVATSEDFKANAYELKDKLRSLKKVDTERAHEINAQMMSIAAVLGQSLIAIGIWEQPWYPYQQPANDVFYMDMAIGTLSKPDVTDGDITDAIWELNWVGLIWYYDYMCKPNYLDQYSRLCGDEQASWGTQTHLMPVPEIWDEYDALNQLAYDEDVTSDDLAPIIASLEEKLVEVAFYNLEEALKTMWTGLEDANAQLESLIASL